MIIIGLFSYTLARSLAQLVASKRIGKPLSPSYILIIFFCNKFQSNFHLVSKMLAGIILECVPNSDYFPISIYVELKALEP